jgi:hypothetical protein
MRFLTTELKADATSAKRTGTSLKKLINSVKYIKEHDQIDLLSDSDSKTLEAAAAILAKMGNKLSGAHATAIKAEKEKASALAKLEAEALAAMKEWPQTTVFDKVVIIAGGSQRRFDALKDGLGSRQYFNKDEFDMSFSEALNDLAGRAACQSYDNKTPVKTIIANARPKLAEHAVKPSVIALAAKVAHKIDPADVSIKSDSAYQF